MEALLHNLRLVDNLERVSRARDLALNKKVRIGAAKQVLALELVGSEEQRHVVAVVVALLGADRDAARTSRLRA